MGGAAAARTPQRLDRTRPAARRGDRQRQLPVFRGAGAGRCGRTVLGAADFRRAAAGRTGGARHPDAARRDHSLPARTAGVAGAGFPGRRRGGGAHRRQQRHTGHRIVLRAACAHPAGCRTGHRLPGHVGRAAPEAARPAAARTGAQGVPATASEEVRAVIFPNPEAGHRSASAPKVKTPWGTRNQLPGWWRVLALRHGAALQRLVHAALLAGPALAELDDAALDDEIAQARSALRVAVARSGLDGAQPEWSRALAAAAEAASRSCGWRPSDQQLCATLAMVQGRMVDAGPCSGKTLAVALAAVLGVWAERFCHVVCPNDLLATRHALAMSPLYRRCGVAVAALHLQTPPADAAVAYRAAVLYATARRLLGDRARQQADWPGPRAGAAGRYMALVDDADRVLIDEAVAPFVTSDAGHNPMLIEGVLLGRAMAMRFVRGQHYVDRRTHLRFTVAGRQLLEALAPELPELWRAPRRRDELIMQALVVRDRFVRGKHYDVQPDPQTQRPRIVFGDVSIGALVPERTLHMGLTQAIEALEGLPLTHPPKTTARSSYQEFFGSYRRLGGVASELRGMEDEFWRVYGCVSLRLRRGGLGAARVHHVVSRDESDRRARTADIAADHAARGQAVLIGLRRMDSFRPLMESLRKLGVEPRLLGSAPPQPGDWTLRAGQVLLVPEVLLVGADLQLDDPETPLLLVLPEPLESARAERSFWARGARLSSQRHGVRLWAADPGQAAAPRLADTVGRRLPAAAASAGQVLLLRLGLHRARWHALRLARLQRHQLFLQEQQLLLQLSFVSRPTPGPSLNAGDPHVQKS
ncbi:hypothetical protein GN316_18840 [Xylophilus sp. Kf1]|nr:hypothetical protein [Xylophilus sp. Kf1]